MRTARDLIHQLAAAISMPPPDATLSTWKLALDERVVTLEDAGAVLILSTPLGTALRAHPASFWQHLLLLNAALVTADRGAITIDQPGHTMSLTQVWPASLYASRNVAECFSTFVAQARRLVDHLNAALPLDASPDEEAPDAGPVAYSTQPSIIPV